MIKQNEILELLTNVRKRPDGNIKANCPWCGKNEFYINVNLSHYPFQCWRKNACGEEGNVFKLLKKLGRLDLLKQHKPENTDVLTLLTLIKKEKNPYSINFQLPSVNLPAGFQRCYDNEYLKSRNFNDFEKYIVGQTNILKLWQDYIIIAVQQQSKITGYIGRYIGQDPTKKKYRNAMCDFGKMIFGLDDITLNTKTVILTEGIFDKINVDYQLSLQKQNEIVCLSTFGCKISFEQICLLKQFNIEKIILFYDNDVADKIKRYAIELNKHFSNIYIAHFNQQGVDAGELTQSQLIESLSNLYSIDQYLVSAIKIKKLM